MTQPTELGSLATLLLVFDTNSKFILNNNNPMKKIKIKKLVSQMNPVFLSNEMDEISTEHFAGRTVT